RLTAPYTTFPYTLCLHDALPISAVHGVQESAGQIADEGAQGHGCAGDLTGDLDLIHGGEIDGTHTEHQSADAEGEGHAYHHPHLDRKSTRLNTSHASTSYAVFCL